MNTSNPNTPASAPASAPAQPAGKSSWMDYIAPLIGAGVGGFVAHSFLGGEILTTLIGAGVGALAGGMIKNWIAPNTTDVTAPPGGGAKSPNGYGQQRGAGSPGMDDVARNNAAEAAAAAERFANSQPSPGPIPPASKPPVKASAPARP